MHLM